VGVLVHHVSRPRVGRAEAQFGTSGFNPCAQALPSGRFRIVAYGRSLVPGTFNVAAVVGVSVR
jgi:hypothetical protein